MSLIKFTADPNGKIYNTKLQDVNANVIRLTFASASDMPTSQDVLLRGFSSVNEFNGEVMTTWTGYSTVYRTYDDATKIELSNNGEIYVPQVMDVVVSVTWNDSDNEDAIRPTSLKVDLLKDGVKSETITLNDKVDWKKELKGLPIAKYSIEIPGVEGYESSAYSTTATYSHTPIRQVRTTKIQELNSAATNVITEGADIELSNGNTERFNFSQYVTQNLGTAYNAASALISINQPTQQVPFYDESNTCQLYAAVDIVKIYLTMSMVTTINITLAHKLEDMINNMTDAEAIKALSFDVSSLDESHLLEYNTILTQTQNVIDIISGTITA